MRLVTFAPSGDGPRLGALADGAVVDIATPLAPVETDMIGLLRAGAAGVDLARRAPVPTPAKSLGIGRNYGAHAAEGGLAAQEKPRIFVKLSSAVIGTAAPIPKPAAVTKLDYE